MAFYFQQNKSNDKYFANLTQKLANYLPEYFYARYDKHSMFQGFMNPLMEYMENAFSSAKSSVGFDNIVSWIKHSIATIGEVSLGNQFEFSMYVDSKGVSRFVPPVVIGNPSTDNIELQILPDNDMVSLIDVMPTRGDFIYHEPVAGLVFSGSIFKGQTFINKYVTGSLSGITNPDGFIFIEITDAPIIDHANIATPAIIIAGRDYAGNIISDKIEFYKKGLYKTNIKFSYITGLKSVNVVNPININIYDYPANSAIYDVFDHDEFTRNDSRDEQVLMYRLLTTWSSFLTYASIPYNNMIELITVSDVGDVINSYELKDVNNKNITGVVSAVPSVNNKIYIATQTSIYIFEKRDKISNLFPKFRGHEQMVELAPVFSEINTSRDLYASGTAVAISQTSFVDSAGTYSDNELVGKCVVIDNNEYVVISNTETIITVSQSPNNFVDLTTVIPAAAPYLIVEYNVKVDIARVIDGEKPRRVSIAIESEYGYTYYINENGFTEASDSWLNNHPKTAEDDISFGEIILPLPFDGSYLITYEFELYDGRNTSRQQFDVIYVVPSKKALAQLDVSSFGKSIVGMYEDNGFIRVVFDDNTSSLLDEIKDYFVVDVSNKKIIVFEQYDEISPTNTKPLYKDITTPLDNFGISFGVDRISGEDLYKYSYRIIDRYKNMPGNTYKGTVNAIGRNLGFITSTPIEINIVPLFSPITIDGVNVYAVEDILYDNTASYNVDEFVGMTLSINGVLFEIIENGAQFIVVGNKALQAIIGDQAVKEYTILPVKSPFIKVTPTRMLLYSNYLDDINNVLDIEIELGMEKTVYDVHNELNSLSSVFSSSLVSLKHGDPKTMVSRAIMPQNNIMTTVVNGTGSKQVFLGVSNVVPGSVKSFSGPLINEKASLNDVTSDGDFFVDVFSGIISAFNPVNQNVEISALYTVIPFRLYASPIILSDIRDNEYTRVLFEQREKQVYSSDNDRYINGTPLDQFFLDYELLGRHNNIHWGK